LRTSEILLFCNALGTPIIIIPATPALFAIDLIWVVESALRIQIVWLAGEIVVVARGRMEWRRSTPDWAPSIMVSRHNRRLGGRTHAIAPQGIITASHARP